MRKVYDKELKVLSGDLIRMAALSEDAIKKAIKALITKDAELCRSVIEEDREINALENKIEQHALKIIYREQPVSEDLRHVSTALKMVTDIERIADQAADICQIVLKFVDVEYCKEIHHIPKMAEAAIEMVGKSVQSYANGDINLAKEVIKKDDDVDKFFEVIKEELIGILKKKPEHAEQIIYFMMIAKYVERIGDHACNIAEWVIFNLTGIHKNARIL